MEVVLPRENPTLFSTEFATNMTLLPGSNEKAEKTKDWQKYKKGSCRYVLSHSPKKDNWHELSLCYQLPSKVDIGAFKVGFLSQWQEYSEMIVAEPSYVHLHYREGLTWKYLCELKRYDDNGFNISSTVIYQKNFLRT